jgi:hypothetical protein
VAFEYTFCCVFPWPWEKNGWCPDTLWTHVMHAGRFWACNGLIENMGLLGLWQLCEELLHCKEFFTPLVWTTKITKLGW